MMQNLKAYDYEPEKTEQYIDDMFGDIEDGDDPCSKSNIVIKNNVGANDKDTGTVEDDYDPGF